MADATARKPQAGMDVLDLEIRMLPEDLLRRHPGSKKLQNVGHANPHAANARTPSTLPRVDGDPIHQLSHARSLAQVGSPAELPTDLLIRTDRTGKPSEGATTIPPSARPTLFAIPECPPSLQRPCRLQTRRPWPHSTITTPAKRSGVYPGPAAPFRKSTSPQSLPMKPGRPAWSRCLGDFGTLNRGSGFRGGVAQVVHIAAG